MGMSQQTAETGAAMAAKAAPPVAVSAAGIAGMPIAEWVQWATLIYLAVMIGHKCWSWHREWRKGREVGND